jgi:hypothetical protein
MVTIVKTSSPSKRQLFLVESATYWGQPWQSAKGLQSGGTTMSEGSFWPRSWKEALPLMVWGILIFAAGFEGIAALVHGEWLPCFFSFAIMLVLTAMLLHWKAWLDRVSPNWVAGAAVALIIAIAVWPAVRQGAWPVVSWDSVGVGVLGTVIVAAIVVAFASLFIVRKPVAPIAPSCDATGPLAINAQTQLDVSHLLDFVVSEAAFWVLDGLLDLSESPEITEGFGDGEDTEKAHKSREFFVGEVRNQLGAGTFRQLSFLNLMHTAQWEAERELEQTPPENRPTDIDPLVLRKYKISERQFWRAVRFLRSQRREVKEKLGNSRHSLSERINEREKSGRG